MVTRQETAERIAAYLRHERSLDELVEWAESALMESDLADDDTEAIAAVLARLGVADVRAFGLAWEDCEDLLGKLGYEARVEIVSR